MRVRRALIAIVLLLVGAATATIVLMPGSSPSPPVLAGRAPAYAGRLASRQVVAAPAVGDVLSATTGAWTNNPTSIAYKWEECNRAGRRCSVIAGAVSSSYRIASRDRGRRIRVLVTAASSAGLQSQVSAATGIVSEAEATANVFVAPGGNDSGPRCVRFAQPTTFPLDRTAVCQTFAHAYALARPGDTILVGNGSYESDQTICRGGALPPCPLGRFDKGSTPIIFKAETRHRPVINGIIYLGDGAGGGANPPSYVTLDGIDVNGQIVTHFTAGSAKATNITIENGHVWEVHEYRIPGEPVIENSQVDDMRVVHEEIGPICCQGDALGGGLADSKVPVNMVVDHSSIHDLYDSCSELPAPVTARYGPCDTTKNKGFADNGNGDHVDGIQIWGADGLRLTNDRWWGIGVPAAKASGQTIFLEADPTGVGGYYRNVLIENNMIYSGSLGNNTISMDKSGGTVPDSGYVKILYNTVWSDNRQFGNIALYAGTFASGTTVTVVGNIARFGPGCTVSAYGGGTIKVVENHNEWANPPLCTDDHEAAPKFAVSNVFDPNENLAGPQWAIDNGDSVFCPAEVPTDIHGTRRPVGAACDVGADEAG